MEAAGSAAWRTRAFLSSMIAATGNDGTGSDESSSSSSSWSESREFRLDNNSIYKPSYYLTNNANDDHCFCSELPPASSSHHISPTAAVSYIKFWSKVAIRRLARVYFGSPVLLALTPLLVGLLVGFLLGSSWQKKQPKPVSGSSKNPSTKFARSSRTSPVAWKESMISIQRAFSCGWIVLLSYVQLLFRQHEPVRETTAIDNAERDDKTRTELLSDANTVRESGVDRHLVPRHVAVIMDGNRRYGRKRYGSATRGHWDGSKTLVDFSKWCIAEGIEALTVYAFSTENWDRDPAEVAALMKIFCKYCDELRIEAIQRDIRCVVLSTETERIPEDVKEGLDRMMKETEHCQTFTLNICLSYGSRGEIVHACKGVVKGFMDGVYKSVNEVNEAIISQHLLTSHCSDPDLLIRTSGELRLSNFLLWQLAYSELFFLDKPWPELEKQDLLSVIRSYAKERERRFGK
eukprot:scaffold38132_cov40-Attheya_sp.AAC.2